MAHIPAPLRRGTFFGGREFAANPAPRFRPQQEGKPWAVNDLKLSKTNRAAAVRAPTNLPSCGQMAQTSQVSRKAGRNDLLGLAKAHSADDRSQLPTSGKHQGAAVVTSRNPRTQLVAPPAAVLHYDAFFRNSCTPGPCRVGETKKTAGRKKMEKFPVKMHHAKWQVRTYGRAKFAS